METSHEKGLNANDSENLNRLKETDRPKRDRTLKNPSKYRQIYRQKKNEKDEFLLKEAVKLQNENRELSLEEREVLRLAKKVEATRLRRKEISYQTRKKRLAALKPEEKEVLKLKKQMYYQKRREKMTDDLKEKKRIEILESRRQYRERKNEKDELLIKEAFKLQSENRELSVKEKEVLRQAKELEAYRLKRKVALSTNRLKRIAALTPEEKEDRRLKRQLRRQKRKQIEASKDEVTKQKIRMERLENLKLYRQKKLEQYELIQREAVKLQSENRELSIEEKEVLRKAQELKDARYKKYPRKKKTESEDKRKKKEEARKLLLSKKLKGKPIEEVTKLLSQTKNTKMSSEQREIQELALKIKAKRLKTNEYRKKQYDALPPEQKEVLRLRSIERGKKRRATKSAENRRKELEYLKRKREQRIKKEGIIQSEAFMLLNQHRELSLKEKEVVRLANEIEVSRLKRKEISNQNRRILKANKRDKQLNKNQASGEKLFQTEVCWTPSEQTTSNFDFIINEIKIENEEIINTNISARLQEGLIHSSWRSFDGASSSSEQDFFINGTQIDRRKNCIEKSLNSIRALIENYAKGDEFAVFGKLTAQKLRNSNTDVAEVKIAKLLIDNVLQNLEIGLYNNSDNEIIV